MKEQTNGMIIDLERKRQMEASNDNSETISKLSNSFLLWQTLKKVNDRKQKEKPYNAEWFIPFEFKSQTIFKNFSLAA